MTAAGACRRRAAPPAEAGTGARESKGQAVVRFIEQAFPIFGRARQSIWGAEAAANPNYVAFPEAQIHGVDQGQVVALSHCAPALG